MCRQNGISVTLLNDDTKEYRVSRPQSLMTVSWRARMQRQKRQRTRLNCWILQTNRRTATRNRHDKGVFSYRSSSVPNECTAGGRRHVCRDTFRYLRAGWIVLSASLIMVLTIGFRRFYRVLIFQIDIIKTVFSSPSENFLEEGQEPTVFDAFLKINLVFLFFYAHFV